MALSASQVTSKGRVTIPKDIRKQLGIRRGTRLEFSLVDDRVEIRVQERAENTASSGFGMLESRRKPVPPDFDVAELTAGA